MEFVKKNNIYILCGLMIAFFSCNNNTKHELLNNDIVVKDTTALKDVVVKEKAIKDVLNKEVFFQKLQGVWGEDTIDNAFFRISKDSIMYVETLNTYFLEVKNKKVMYVHFGDEDIMKMQVNLLTPDLMVLIDEDLDTIGKYLRYP